MSEPKRESSDDRERRLRALTDGGETISRAEYARRSRRSFLAFGALGIGGYLGFRTLQNRPSADGIPDTLRNGLAWNEDVWETAQRDVARSRAFDPADREDLRVNGRLGLRSDLADGAAENWKIDLIGVGEVGLGPLTLDAIKGLEVHDMVWEHKCIEGWSNIVQWTGVRFSEVASAFASDQSDWDYIALRTPDNQYYVGLDRYTMLHPQTLLAWQLNGEPLTADHGAPIRLVTPLKYGIKQLKRVASIEFTSTKPADYWAERGYDYHSGF